MRYSMFDKYFKTIPCYTVDCTAVNWTTGWNSTFYLIGWYMSFGGPIDDTNFTNRRILVDDTNWGFRTGADHIHQGYQNVFTAYVLSNIPEFHPNTTGGQGQWEGVLSTTLSFWEWLQSSEGAIAGGATNSFNGQYENPQKYNVTGYFSNGLGMIHPNPYFSL
eukprot:526204_1